MGESDIFLPYQDKNDFCVSGFSLGGIEAFQYACIARTRIDKLQLFSPAFFEDKDEKFKRLQEMYFKKDKDLYVKNFLENITYPSSVNMQKFYHDSDYEDLHKLLHFTWSKEKLQMIKEKGIMIEVYLGVEDKIIDVEKVKTFFQEYATVIMIKNSGHILKGKQRWIR